MLVSYRFWYDGKIKKLATICRNYKIYLLEVPIIKLQTTVKNYHEQGLHQLELKFLPVISTNFNGSFQSTINELFPLSQRASGCCQMV